jgi:D-alanyl-D-alanine carboxypeptidase (penicillin-binding protein 5/6)
LLVDVGSGRILFARDANRRFVPASITKIMTSYVAFDLITKGKLKLDQRMPMRPETFRQWHRVGSTMFIPADGQPTVAELLEGIVTVSANDACVVLAEGATGSVPAFTKLMNDAAAGLGMRDSHFNTPNGWMDEGRTFVTATDLATLSSALMTRFPDLYRQFYGHSEMTWNGITQPNHNPLYGVTEGADGIKTGFTNEAGYGFVGSAQRKGRRLVMVLGGYDRPKDRAQQSRDLIEWGFAAWSAQPLFAKGARVADAEVQEGQERTVPLIAPRALSITSPNGSRPAYSLAVRYKGPLRAPIAAGETVASLLVRVPGEPVQVLPLVAATSVAKGGTAERMRDGALRLIGL